jgi:coproporphyrinogen III oxidase-like Fe-S oxidoreductase
MLEYNEKPVSGSETLSQIDHFNEVVFNGLRTREGIQLRNIHPWETDLKKMNPSILKWKDQLDITKETIFLKSDSYKYADAIASDMMITEPQ